MSHDFNNETERVHHHYEETASQYDKKIDFSEKVLFGDGRSWVCSQAQGEVLEIAVGTGLNFRHYPDDVKLTGIDLSLAMLQIARRRAQELGRDVDLRVGDAYRWRPRGSPRRGSRGRGRLLPGRPRRDRFLQRRQGLARREGAVL